jgi:hypothetical protein
MSHTVTFPEPCWATGAARVRREDHLGFVTALAVGEHPGATNVNREEYR